MPRTGLTLGSRPEHLILTDAGIPGTVAGVEWLGSDAIVRVRYDNHGADDMLVVRCDGETGVERGDSVHIGFYRRIHVFDENGLRIAD